MYGWSGGDLAMDLETAGGAAPPWWGKAKLSLKRHRGLHSQRRMQRGFPHTQGGTLY